MNITNDPPKIGKHPIIDKQFGDWWLFLNGLGVTAFLMFLACLGTGEHKHSCAVLSCSLLVWGYIAGLNNFPRYMERLRRERSYRAQLLEKSIWLEHFYKRPHHYFPLVLGIGTLGSITVWPATGGDWNAYLSFFVR